MELLKMIASAFIGAISALGYQKLSDKKENKPE